MKLTGITRALLFLLLLHFFTTTTVAQLAADDSIFYQKAVNNAVALYHRSLGDQSGLYNGSQYAGYPFMFKEGHPFFYMDTMSNGAVVYDNVLYKDVDLLFDEIAEQVIMQDRTHKIQLLSSRISRFSVFNNDFIRLVKDSLNNFIEATGFYQLLYEGNTSVLKKEVKTIREEIRSPVEGVLRFIETQRYYYIKKNNVFYPVKRKKDVFNIYADHKKDIQQYIKSNKFSFKKDRDNMLVKVTAWYDQLTK